ncbi:hypothetical protein LKI01_02660 [Companilactobacillus paralimentarius]|nr:hypothetical protein LKI01_02660 [Companilactobacillus paralimentarius]
MRLFLIKKRGHLILCQNQMASFLLCIWHALIYSHLNKQHVILKEYKF